MESLPGKPRKPPFVDVLDLATASTIVLGTTAFFAFVYFLPESKPKAPEQIEDQASKPAPRAKPVLDPPLRAAINISRVEAPAVAPPEGAPRLPPQPAPLPDPSTARFDEGLRTAQKHWDKGIVAYQKGDFLEARKEWTLCLESNPDHPDCRTGSLRLDSNGVAGSTPPLGRPGPSRAAPKPKNAPELRRLVVFFEKGKAAVDARAASVLDATAKLLELYPLTRLRVVAFADREEFDPGSLAKQRAEEVRGALLSRKLSPDRVVCQVQVVEEAAFRAELYIER